MTGGLRIIEPGLATTIQDGGRVGYRRFGVPTAGAIDTVSWRLANALAGAPSGAAALEFRVVGATLEADAERVRVGFVGAPARLRIDRAADGSIEDIPAGPTLWPSLVLNRGDRLRIGPLQGLTAYLAIEGGVDAPLVLGSRATSLKGGFGGLDGRMLRAGDRLPLGAAGRAEDEKPRGLRYDLVAPGGPTLLRAVPGPQDDLFAPESMERFFSDVWTVSATADRMGLRLDGAPLAHRAGHDIVSDGIGAGAVQTPGDGKPILLLADRGTTGGYPKIAAVITADLAAAGRLGPGSRLGFRAVTPEEGRAALRRQEKAIADAIAAIGPLSAPGAVDLERLYQENLVTVQAPDSAEPDA